MAICPPTLGEETNLGINSTLDTTATVPRDFVQENMKVGRRNRVLQMLSVVDIEMIEIES